MIFLRVSLGGQLVLLPWLRSFTRLRTLSWRLSMTSGHTYHQSYPLRFKMCQYQEWKDWPTASVITRGSEDFILKWKFLKDYFKDVILVSDENIPFLAHKFVLSTKRTTLGKSAFMSINLFEWNLQKRARVNPSAYVLRRIDLWYEICKIVISRNWKRENNRV